MGQLGRTQKSQAASEKQLKAYACELEQKLEARTRELAEARGHLSEALEQQAATSEVLKVISNSPGELEPVFEAMLANATRICEAKFGALYLSDGAEFRTVALHGAPPALAEARRREPVKLRGLTQLFLPSGADPHPSPSGCRRRCSPPLRSASRSTRR